MKDPLKASCWAVSLEAVETNGRIPGRDSMKRTMRLSKVIWSHSATTAPHSSEADSSRSLKVVIAFNPRDAVEKSNASPFTSFFRISSS